MKSVLSRLVIVSLILVAGCAPLKRQWGAKRTPPPSKAMPAHESWCYKTLAQIDCYPGPQRLPPESLVSVDPPSRFPLTRADHAKAYADYQMSGKAK